MALLMNNWKKILIALFGGSIIPILIEKFYYTDQAFSFDRFSLIYPICLFIMILILFDRKKVLDFVYKFRIAICLIIFAFLVICGYHGSSMGIYTYYIEPETKIQSGEPIMGKLRSIRSDEWMVSTMANLSQDAEINNFSPNSHTLMGKTSNVTFYPRLASKSISIITTPHKIGFLFLPLEQAYSFSWFFGYFALFIASFELFMLMTKQKKGYSLVGALLITLSPAVQWWESNNIQYSGMFAIIFFNKFLTSEKLKHKIIYSLLVGLAGSIYVGCMYPAWMVPYGYFFLGLVIWQLVENKGKYKLKDLIMLVVIASILMAVLILPDYISSKEVFKLVSGTVYPGARFNTGGFGWEYLFNYIVSIFLPFYNFANQSEYSQFISFFPIPLILGMIYIFNGKKGKKKDLLLIILVVVEIFLSIWNYVKLPKIVSKLTLLYMSTEIRSVVVSGFVSVVLLIYCLANYSEKKTEKTTNYYKIATALFIIIYGISVMQKRYGGQYTEFMANVSIVLFGVLGSLILINSDKTKKILLPALGILAIAAGITVHPLTKGLDIVYKKPFAKEVRKIVKKDPEALWINSNSALPINNYILANGAKILNSTNYYPNYDLWDILDEDREYEKYWNRYAHMDILLTDDETNVSLVQADYIKLHLNPNDICKIGAKYMASLDGGLTRYSNEVVNIKNIYAHENISIYKIKCN